MKVLENYRAAQFSDKTELNDKELQMKNKVKLDSPLSEHLFSCVYKYVQLSEKEKKIWTLTIVMGLSNY